MLSKILTSNGKWNYSKKRDSSKILEYLIKNLTSKFQEIENKNLKPKLLKNIKKKLIIWWEKSFHYIKKEMSVKDIDKLLQCLLYRCE